MTRTGTEKTHAPDGSLTVSEIGRREKSFYDGQEITVRCGLCADWSYTGRADEARIVAQLHRAQRHPTLRNGAHSKNEKIAAARQARTDRENAEREATVERGRQRAALEALDQGEPQPVLREVAAVGVQADSGDADADLTPLRGEPERAATSPTTDNERTSMDRPKTRDDIVAAFIRFRNEHGRLPLPSDAADADYLPTREFARHTANAGFESWQAVWDHFDAGKLPMGRAAGNYRASGVLGGGNASRRRPATRRKPAARRPRPAPVAAGSNASKAERLLAAATAVDTAEAALEQARVELKQAVQELAA